MTSSTTLSAIVSEVAGQLAHGEAAAQKTISINWRREAEALVLAGLGLSRTALLTDPERSIQAAELARLRDWTARRALGEPLAYLTGEREFWSLPLRVTPDVLVPRPETELLVERALLRAGPHPNPTVVDLGTGSGAIALALAHERPTWRIFATDRSPAALEIARANAIRLGLGRVSFLLGDWFDALRGLGSDLRMDLVLANPPYVSDDDPALTGDSLRFEPRAALTPGKDALVDLHALIDEAPSHLAPGGWLLLEHGATQAAAVRARLVARGFTHVGSHRDLAGHERMTEGRWRI